jgi:hypothetical protein
MLMRVFLAILIDLLPLAAATADQLSFVCDEPHGMRVDYGTNFALDGRAFQSFADGPEWSKDGFSGVHPTLVIRPSEMIVTWGDAIPESIKALVHPETTPDVVPISGQDDASVFGVLIKARTIEVFRFYFWYRLLFLYTSSYSPSLQDPKSAPAMNSINISKCREVR